MISAVLTAVVTMSVGATTPMDHGAGWEPVFERGTEEKWIGAVHAFERDDWLVAGSWGITRSTRGHVERREVPGHAVHTLIEDAAGTVFALGAGALVLRLDGRTWSEEHAAEVPHGRQQSADALLYSMFQLEGEARAVAFGPRLVLTRTGAGSWIKPSQTDGIRLTEAAQSGAPQAWRLAKCQRYAWFWIDRSRGWASCRDGRTFLFSGAAIEETGKKSSRCPIVVSVSSRSGETYVACSNETLWRVKAAGWQSIEPPPSARTIVSVASVANCLFVATTAKVWRRCDLTSGGQ